MAKKKVTQGDIARACKLDQGSVSRILNKDTRDSFSPETVERVFEEARQMGYLHPSLVSSNRRGSERQEVRWRAQILIVIGSSTVYDEGSAEVRDISGGGMLLTAIRTKKQSLPLDHFRVDAEIEGPKVKDLRLRCRVVRFDDRYDEFALALRFEHLDEETRRKIEGMVKG